ncbi:MAG: ATPase [Thermoproteus sp.]
MLNITDSPFNPSGVTHLHRLHRALGFDKELAQIADLFDLVAKTRNNVLAVVVAPYGYGKSEFLDEVQREADSRGLRTIRVALTHTFKEDILRSLQEKRQGEPLLVLIDEADELSRIAAMHRLGALSNDEFRQAVMDLASIVRALLEPRNYPQVLKNPENYDRVLVIAALTPQVYYTILKNVVPDVFDLTTGRVYKEIVLDTRYPFWLFVEMVASRLDAYIRAKRPDKLWPFTLGELAALYNIAVKKGEVSPRYLLKLAARLFELKNKGKGLAELAEEEGIYIQKKELVEYILSGLPAINIEEKYIDIFKKKYLYRIPFSDKEAVAAVNRFLKLRGGEIKPTDERSASYEPNLYYTIMENGELMIYFVHDEVLEELREYLLGEAYVVSDDVISAADKREDMYRISKELLAKLQDPQQFLNEIEKILDLNGIKIKICCGKAIWYNNLGFRELILLIYLDKENDINNIRGFMSKIIAEGALEEYPIDYIIAYIFSNVLLTDELEASISQLLKISWKNLYIDSAGKYVYLNIYGADKLDRLKTDIVKFQIDRILGRDAGPLEMLENLKLYREKARENVLKYTLALRRGKERKELSLLKVAEQLISGEVPEGMTAYHRVVDVLIRGIENDMHEKELKTFIARLFPVNLWRDLREDDLVTLMIYTGYLIPRDDRIYVKFNMEDARRYLEALSKELYTYSEVTVSFKSKIFGEIKLSKKLDIEKIPLEFKDAKEYAALVVRLKKALLAAQQEAVAVRGELEQELRAKKDLVGILEKLAERMPQRIKYMALDEKVAERESTILKAVDEIMEIWKGLHPLARELGKAISVEADLGILLNLPEPWVEDYLATLRLYSVKLREEYEAYRKDSERRRRVAEWVKVRLGASDGVDEVLKKKSEELQVPYRLLYAIASRGPGAELDPDVLASEASMEAWLVSKYLDVLAEKGLVAKKYVS